jgi:peptidoglycan-associated lipoprotein
VLAALKTIYFDFDKYNLRDDAKRTLEGNAKVLMANPRARIVIEGHCDERGTTEYNLALGERRASTARDYLIRLGVAASQISIISYGEERPVSLGHDEDSWATNRRGEFGPR